MFYLLEFTFDDDSRAHAFAKKKSKERVDSKSMTCEYDFEIVILN